MAKFWASMAPTSRTKAYKGHNVVHPFAVGYETKLLQSLLNAALGQDMKCPIDGRDLTGCIATNPVYGVVGCEWFEEQAICDPCRRWLVRGEDAVDVSSLTKIKGCHSWQEFRRLLP